MLFSFSSDLRQGDATAAAPAEQRGRDPIGLHEHGAVFGGVEHLHSPALETIHHHLCRVAEAVVAAGAEDGPSRRERVEELVAAR